MRGCPDVRIWDLHVPRSRTEGQEASGQAEVLVGAATVYEDAMNVVEKGLVVAGATLYLADSLDRWGIWRVLLALVAGMVASVGGRALERAVWWLEKPDVGQPTIRQKGRAA